MSFLIKSFLGGIFAPDPRLATPEGRLLQACRDGDLKAVTAALQEGASVNAKTSEGETALFVAAREGQAAVLSTLLEHGAAVEMGSTVEVGGGAPPILGRTALHAAVQAQHVHAAAVLLGEGGANALAEDSEGWSALALAYKGGDPDLATLLRRSVEKRSTRSAAGSAAGTAQAAHPSSQEAQPEGSIFLPPLDTPPPAVASSPGGADGSVVTDDGDDGEVVQGVA